MYNRTSIYLRGYIEYDEFAPDKPRQIFICMQADNGN